MCHGECGGCVSACVCVCVRVRACVCTCLVTGGGHWEVIKIAMKVTIGVINRMVFRVSASLKCLITSAVNG